MEDHKKVFPTQILIEVQVEVLKLHFEINTEVRMVDIINTKVNFMEVDEETLKEKLVEVVMEVIKVNNQIAIQTTIIVGNLGTWQKIVIKKEHDA